MLLHACLVCVAQHDRHGTPCLVPTPFLALRHGHSPFRYHAMAWHVGSHLPCLCVVPLVPHLRCCCHVTKLLLAFIMAAVGPMRPPVLPMRSIMRACLLLPLQVSMWAMPLYAVLPTLTEFCVEQGWTMAYSRYARCDDAAEAFAAMCLLLCHAGQALRASGMGQP